MADEKDQNPNHRPQPQPQPPLPPPSSSNHYHHPRYPNPPESNIPDAETLREQWNYAKRQYSRWYSSAWGTAILAGLSFYALGWIIKGSNPLPSLSSSSNKNNKNNNSSSNSDTVDKVTAAGEEAHQSPKPWSALNLGLIDTREKLFAGTESQLSG